MNLYELSCYYCGYSWQINYEPRDTIYCIKCKDKNLRLINIATQKVNYYVGSPPFPEKEKEDPDKWYI